MIETMTTAEAAEELGVHPVTLRKWRVNSEPLHKFGFGDGWMEDCQGLTWRFEHPKKIVYCAKGVHWLKKLLQRRNNKQCQQQ